MSSTFIQPRCGQRWRRWPPIDHPWHLCRQFSITAHGSRKSQLRGSWTTSGTRSRHLQRRRCRWRIGHGIDRVPINQRTAVRRRRNPQGQLGRLGTIAIMMPRNRRAQQRHRRRSSSRRRRHGEIALPLPRQEQLVRVGSSSQIGGVVGGHFGESYTAEPSFSSLLFSPLVYGFERVFEYKAWACEVLRPEVGS